MCYLSPSDAAMHYLLSVYLLTYSTTLGAAAVKNRERFGLPAKPQPFSSSELPMFVTNHQQLRAIFDNYTEQGVVDATTVTPKRMSLEENPLVMTLKEQLLLLSHSHGGSKSKVLNALQLVGSTSSTWSLSKSSPATLTARPFGRLSLDQLRLFAKHFQICPQIVNSEELSGFYRHMQSVEWMRWMAENTRSRRGGPRYPDLLHQMLEHGSLRMPPSQQALALSFRYSQSM